MKINITFFKPSGKYYTSGQVEIPDDSNIWDKGMYELIMNTQKVIGCIDGKTDFYLQTSTTPEDSDKGKFFEHLFMPRNEK